MIAAALILMACAPVEASACAPGYEWETWRANVQERNPGLAEMTLDEERAAMLLAAFNASEPVSDFKVDVVTILFRPGFDVMLLVFVFEGCVVLADMYPLEAIATWYGGWPVLFGPQPMGSRT